MIVGLEFLAGPGMLIIAVILVNTRWWKNLTEYYFSWNESTEEYDDDRSGCD